MNKYEKALEELSYPSWESPCSGCKCGTSDCLDCKKAQAVLTLEELVEKATPKEPIYINECEEWKPIFGYICPCCSDWVNNGANYCSGCGQALDWSEEDVD